MWKAFRNKGTKLMAAMVAMVMVIAVAKVPVKAYMWEWSTPNETFPDGVKPHGRSFVERSRQSAGADTWVEGGASIQYTTVILEDLSMRELNVHTGSYNTKTHSPDMAPTGLTITMNVTNNNYIVYSMSAKHRIPTYKWEKETSVKTMS